jgi:hypothetical protein
MAMRPRTIILILAGVLAINALTILGGWAWSKGRTSTASSTQAAGAEKPRVPLPAAEVAGLWAEFGTPRDGEAVPRRFRASGRCAPLPVGTHLVLVVDSGKEVFSPKLPPPAVEGETWSGNANEFGAPNGGNFSLCIFAVSTEALEQITQWHEQGKATGKWPPFRGIVPGTAPLAKIKLRVASK